VSDEDALERVYEEHLLGMAVAACEERRCYLRVWPALDNGPRVWQVVAFENDTDNTAALVDGPTLADALCALLRDLGVEDVPARVSAEEVREAWERIVVDAANIFPRNALGSVPFAFERLRALYARDEGGRLLAVSILAAGS